MLFFLQNFNLRRLLIELSPQTAYFFIGVEDCFRSFFFKAVKLCQREASFWARWGNLKDLWEFFFTSLQYSWINAKNTRQHNGPASYDFKIYYDRFTSNVNINEDALPWALLGQTCFAIFVSYHTAFIRIFFNKLDSLYTKLQLSRQRTWKKAPLKQG